MTSDADNSYYAVLFQRNEGETAGPEVQEHFDLEDSVRNRIVDLESELQQNRENLQATIEELQSTNEELQSVNEELITVNSEYQKKIEERSELNDDMDNLLASTDLAHNLNYPNLGADIRSVLQSLTAQTTEIQNEAGVWLQVKLIPYRSDANRVGGIVITLIEIHDRKSAELALVRQHDLPMSILESNPSGITMVDRNGKIVYANRKAERLLGLQKSALSGIQH